MSLKIEFLDSGREPRCAPNPDFPNGIDIDLSNGQLFCEQLLPYPAERCGVFKVTCERCGFSVGITAAGRIDDPRSVKLPCKISSAIQ